MTQERLHFFALALIGLALGSCSLLRKAPGTAVVQFYNHSGHRILVEENELRPGRTGTFEYPTDSGKPLIVFWEGCVHTYIAPDRKPGDFSARDWMLRDAYRVQLEPDAMLYLLPADATPPADTQTLKQPEGFPLKPREGSSCLQ
jgi:hypothetical protein